MSCSASASGAEVIIATPTRMLGCSPSRNGDSARMWRSGWRKIWKLACGSVSGTMPICTPIGSSAISAVKCSASARASARRSFERRLRQVVAADQAVAQEALHLGRRDQVDDAGLALAVAFLALAQHAHQLVDLRQRALAAFVAFRDVLAQHVRQRAVERVGGEQIRDRAGQHDDVLGGLLDLAHALEIGDRRGDVFDADAEQRRDRDAEQLGELFQRLDLGELALLEAVERGARNAEAVGDLVGGKPGAEAKRLQPVSDIVEADGHR